MPKLPRLSGREAAKAFVKAGFVFDHQSGSHMIYYRQDGKHLSIPDHRELDTGLLRRLIRDAELSGEEFVQLL